MKTRAMIGLLALTSAVASAADAPREVRGRVVDERGRPVAGVDVSTTWSANGLTRDEARKIPEGADLKVSWGQEGRMVPWGDEPSTPTVTGADGRFAIRVGDLERHLLAIDPERRRGGVATFDFSDRPEMVEITLMPLVRVKGTFRVTSHPEPLPYTFARIGLTREPLSGGDLVTCGSVRSHFEVLLPPGQYELLGFTNDQKADSIGNFPMFKTRPHTSFTVDTGPTEVDFGAVELPPYRNFGALEREARARGTFGDAGNRKGRRAPRWSVTDAKGVTRGVQIDDFKGKWVLLYFWSPTCTPCITKTLPDLSAFYEVHRARRDKFEVLAFCIDVEGGLKSMAELDQFLQPAVRRFWGGKPLPFPVLLDNTFRTAESFGITAFGEKLLVDPNGDLVEGDEGTLAEKIRE